MKISNQKKIFYLQKKDGFTLIELLVVIVITGILTAIALPSFMGQVGKARETEAKNNIGAISRAQQAYHFEMKTFANNLSDLNLNGSLPTKYYTFPDPSIATTSLAKHQAIASNPTRDRVRNFASSVYFSTGKFDIAICQSKGVNEAVNTPNDINNPCTNDGVRLK